MDTAPPSAVQSLDYQPPRDAAVDPWVTIVRAVAWAAAAYAGAALLSALFSLMFRWELSGRGPGMFDPAFIVSLFGKLFYVPVLVAALACARLSHGGWLWLTTALAVLIVLHVLVLLGGGIVLVMNGTLSRFGRIGAAGLIGQSAFGVLLQTIPLVLMHWLLTRRGARLVFLTAG